MTIIECKCCVYDKTKADLGLPEEEDWVHFAFKLESVVSIREPTKLTDRDQTIVYFGFDSFWIDIPYKTFLKTFNSQQK